MKKTDIKVYNRKLFLFNLINVSLYSQKLVGSNEIKKERGDIISLTRYTLIVKFNISI